MNQEPNIRVVRVTSLPGFVEEVPPCPDLSGRMPVVRVLGSRHEFEHSCNLSVSLQGVNAAGEIVWLEEIHSVSWLYGKPFGQAAESLSSQIPALEQIVSGWLKAKGYIVREGDYGLPDSVKPLRACFECAVWKRASEHEWVVEPAP